MGYQQPQIASARYQYFNGGQAAGAGGVNATSGAAAYGALATIGAAAFDFDGLYMQVWGAAVRTRISVTANTGGGDEPLVTDVFFDNSTAANRVNFALFAPVYIPKGAVLKWKIAAPVNTDVFATVVQGMQGDARMVRGSPQLISATDFSGVDPVNSITASGTTTTGWVVAQAATTRRIAALYAFWDSLSNGVAGDQTLYQFDIGWGPSGSEQLLTSFVFISGTLGSSVFSIPVFGPFPCDIPAGSRLVYRVTASGATTHVFALVMCGLAA